jgi:hypothetical protein
MHTIEYDGDEKTFEDWRIKNVIGRFANQNPGMVTFLMAESFDSTPAFPYGSEIIIRYGRTLVGAVWTGGTIWFRGTIEVPESVGGSGGELRNYLAKDAWQAMEETIYGQAWAVTGALVTSHVFLNRGITMKQQILNAITSAAASGISIDDGDIDNLGTIISDEANTIMLAEVIRRQLRWAPDTVAWVNYATTPPSLNVKRHANLTAVTCPLGKPINKVLLSARHDLVLPSVFLYFEKSVTVDGRAMMVPSVQFAPAEAVAPTRGSLVGTFDLMGPKITHATADIIAQEIEAKNATEATRLEWWKNRFPALRQARISSVAIAAADVKFYTVGVLPAVIAGTFTVGSGWDVVSYNRGDYVKRVDGGEIQIWQATKTDTCLSTGPETAGNSDMFTYINTVRQEITWATYPYTRELMAESGQLTRWLETQEGFRGEEIEVQAKIVWEGYDAGTGERFGASEYQTVKLMATNAETGNYSTYSGIEEGEEEPALLAAFLYSVGSVLHYDGPVTLLETECSHTYKLGQKLSFTGGTGIYAGIGAIIQSVTEDLDSGKTHLVLGPPGHLGPSDLIEWVRSFRRRRIYTNPDTQDTGELAGVGATETGRKGPTHDSTSGGPLPNRLKMIGASGSVDINPADTNGKTIKLMQVTYLNESCVQKARMFLCSDEYTP